MSGIAELRDRLREDLLEYSEAAFRLLPKMERPAVLDIGCGAGGPTLKLAELSGGEVTGIDVDGPSLEAGRRRAQEHGLQGRVRFRRCSLDDLPFEDESFDLIWAEGCIQFIGFEKGLVYWRRFLRAAGFLVLHADEGDLSARLALIRSAGYRPAAWFSLSEGVWRERYFRPLDEALGRTAGTEAAEETVTARREVESFRKNPQGSAFFVVQRL